MELKDTINMMTSDDYKERFRAEYFQLKIRYDKLKDMVCKYEDGTLDFESSCPIDVLEAQLEAMANYMDMLAIRATIEKVNIY